MRKLLEEAAKEITVMMGKLDEALGENDLGEAKSVWCDLDSLKTRIDSVLSASEPDAMEIVRQVREQVEKYDSILDRGWPEFTLPDSEAAALIADYSKRVPRAMLSRIVSYTTGMIDWNGEFGNDLFIDDIAKKFGYRAE